MSDNPDHTAAVLASYGIDPADWTTRALAEDGISPRDLAMRLDGMRWCIDMLLVMQRQGVRTLWLGIQRVEHVRLGLARELFGRYPELLREFERTEQAESGKG